MSSLGTEASLGEFVAALRETIALLPYHTGSGGTYEGAIRELRRVNDCLRVEQGTESRGEASHPVRGLLNPIAPPLVMERDQQSIRASVTFSRAYEGLPGAVHGGMLAAALSGALSRVPSISKRAGILARIDVRLRRPAPLGRELTVLAQLAQSRSRHLVATAELRDDTQLLAQAQSLIIPRP